MDDGSAHKKAKGTKKCVIKRRLMFENYIDSLFNEKTIFKKQQALKSYYHDVYTEEINKVALSSIQTFDKVTTFPEETQVYAKQKRHLKCQAKSVKTNCM